MPRANFKDPETGKYYHVMGYRMRSIKGVSTYFDGEGSVLTNESGTPLESVSLLDEEIDTDNVITSSITIKYGAMAREKDMKAIKRISKAHNRSDDARHTAQKNARKELKNK